MQINRVLHTLRSSSKSVRHLFPIRLVRPTESGFTGRPGFDFGLNFAASGIGSRCSFGLVPLAFHHAALTSFLARLTFLAIFASSTHFAALLSFRSWVMNLALSFASSFLSFFFLVPCRQLCFLSSSSPAFPSPRPWYSPYCFPFVLSERVLDGLVFENLIGVVANLSVGKSPRSNHKVGVSIALFY